MLTATQLPPPPNQMVVYARRAPELGELGVDIPGLDTMATVGKTLYYVGVGTALIVASMFVWRVADALFGE